MRNKKKCFVLKEKLPNYELGAVPRSSELLGRVMKMRDGGCKQEPGQGKQKIGLLVFLSVEKT